MSKLIAITDEEMADVTDTVYSLAYKKGREDAFQEMIDKCKQYSYVCHSKEFARVLESWRIVNER